MLIYRCGGIVTDPMYKVRSDFKVIILMEGAYTQLLLGSDSYKFGIFFVLSVAFLFSFWLLIFLLFLFLFFG